MLYIKDYRFVHAPENPPLSALQAEFSSIIGKTVTVYVDTGGCVTGILMEVLPDSIKLITRLSKMQNRNVRNTCGHPGTNTYISLNHICAVVYQSL